jgi:hypothetical protein
MSSRRASLLQSKKVMVITLIVLVVSIAVRFKDLMPERTPVAAASDPELELQTPADLARTHQRAAEYVDSMAMASGSGSASADNRRIPSVRNNPFNLSMPAPEMQTTKSSESPESEPSVDEVEAPVPLGCTMIHLQGPASAAIVDGWRVRLGDSVRGCTVKHIDEQGVLLAGKAEFVFLPLRREQGKDTSISIALDQD